MGDTARDRAGSYVLDVAYPDAFHPSLAPAAMAFAAVRAGVRPPDVDAPFGYLDLGCGPGFTPALVAAAHPAATVLGNDVNPAHVATARGRVAAAGLGNAAFVPASFAELADAGVPPMDFVVAHGIWSWVGAANRDHVVALLDACVRPGGLVMVSYNCHAGWDALMPLRGLLAAAAGREGAVGDRVARALASARALRDAGAAYFRETPAASTLIDTLAAADPAYVAHEYFSGDWTLFDHRDVAAALARAGLRYAGPARVMDGFDRLLLTEAQRALVAAAASPAEAEAIRDLILARPFRQDLFVRGGERLDPAAQGAWFAAQRFALVRPREGCTLALATRIGEVRAPEPSGALLDALAQGVATGADLARRTAVSPRAVHEALAMLVAMGHVRPALSPAGDDARRAATRRFNAVALAGARMGDAAPALACPVTGTGMVLPHGDQVLLDAALAGVPLDVFACGDDDRVARFRSEVAPLLGSLGIL